MYHYQAMEIHLPLKVKMMVVLLELFGYLLAVVEYPCPASTPPLSTSFAS
jgi:hypothetical protein